jgi:hypothetical protein
VRGGISLLTLTNDFRRLFSGCPNAGDLLDVAVQAGHVSEIISKPVQGQPSWEVMCVLQGRRQRGLEFELIAKPIHPLKLIQRLNDQE